MNAGLVVSAAAGAAVAFWVLAPLFRKDAVLEERVARARSETLDLQSRREAILASLRDLEDDHDTGKISDDDYRDLKRRLSGQAVEIMKRLDEIEQARAEQDARRRGGSTVPR